jgi:hypothetical protein
MVSQTETTFLYIYIYSFIFKKKLSPFVKPVIPSFDNYSNYYCWSYDVKWFGIQMITITNVETLTSIFFLFI